MAAELGKSTWFGGDQIIGAAVPLSFVLEACVARSGLNQSRSRLMAFLTCIHALPAYQRALARGGDYSIMGD